MALPQQKRTRPSTARMMGRRWAQSARADAAARWRPRVLPGRRDEYWKYHRPDSLLTPRRPGLRCLSR